MNQHIRALAVLTAIMVLCPHALAFSIQDIWTFIRQFIDGLFSIDNESGQDTGKEDIESLFSDILKEDDAVKDYQPDLDDGFGGDLMSSQKDGLKSVSEGLEAVKKEPERMVDDEYVVGEDEKNDGYAGKYGQLTVSEHEDCLSEEDDDERAICLAIGRGDIRMCPQTDYSGFNSWLSDPTGCVWRVIDKMDAPKDCIDMPVRVGLEHWTELCCRFLAIKHNKSSYCRNCTSDSQSANACYSSYIEHRSRLLYTDLDACLEFSDYSDYCLRKVAVNAKDSSVCDNYPLGTQSRALCANEVCLAIMEDEPDIDCCKNVPKIDDDDDGQRYINSCYVRRAQITGDKIWCSPWYVKSNVLKTQRCYASVAKNLGDPGICDEIEQDWIRDDCLLETLGDAKDCARIKDEAKAKQCRIRL